MGQFKRHRGRILVAALIVVGLGLGSRRFPHLLPGFIALYAGDVLWACLVFLGLILGWPNLSRRSAATVALAFSLLIEVSQHYHPPWLDALRAYRLGGLVLGFGFLWSDLVCYACGVALGTILDQAISD